MSLRKKEIKELNATLKELFGWEDFFHPKKDVVEVHDSIYYKNKKPVFFFHDDKLVPFLSVIQENNPLPIIVIDQPAVPFIVKGADVMRPGIVDLDTFEKDAIVSIVDEQHRKVLAIGIALFSSEEIKEMEKGKVIEIIHYVGDEKWNIT